MKSSIPDATFRKLYDIIIIHSKCHENPDVIKNMQKMILDFSFIFKQTLEENKQKVKKDRPLPKFKKLFKEAYPQQYAWMLLQKHKICKTIKQGLNFSCIYLYAFQEYPKCASCGKLIPFAQWQNILLGKEFCCSSKCSALHSIKCAEQQNMEKYGVKNIFASEYFKKNRENFYIKKYGENVTAPLLVPGSLEKRINTSIERFGVSDPARSLIVQEKRKQANLKKYNKTCYYSTQESRDKIRKVCKENGVTGPNKIKEISKEKWQQAAKRGQISKKLKLQSMGLQSEFEVDNIAEYRAKQHYSRKVISFRGKIRQCQGYENIILERLEKREEVKDAITDKCRIGHIAYMYKKKWHLYFPDILITLNNGQKIIVEVKSVYTLLDKTFWNTNALKFKAAKQFYEKQNIAYCVAVVDFNTKNVASFYNDFKKSTFIKILKEKGFIS